MSNSFALPSYLKTATVVAVFALASHAQQGFAAGAPAPNTLPTGGKVVAGSATISQAGNTMNINQSSQRAVVNWNSFDVGSKATVNFNQPNAQAATLNYVNSASKSMINGAVNANGQVIFVNNNGIVFGKGAEVNVGGMVATTMNTSAADFMAGKNVQTYEGGSNGKVINRGNITGNNANSYIALMAPQVKNTGVITATMSGANAVALVAGEKVSLTFNSSQLVSVSVDASVVNALIKNKLLIQAGSGQVIIAANSAQDLMGSVIKNTGTISATGISTAGGKISLTGDTVEQSGTIAANSNTNAGGQVAIQGNNISLKAGSKTTATGASAGGSINVGVNTATAISISTNSQSVANAIQNNQLAKTVTVQENALVDASATQNGNGGSINIWSQVKTFVAGNLVAKGGAQGGNGGSIETSSKGQVQLGQGLTVDTSAPKGKTGLWVVDPTSIIVDSNAASLISNALNTTSVTLDATGSVCSGFGSCTQSQTALIQFVTGANILASNPNTSLNLIANGGLIEINSNIQVGALNAVAEVINVNQGSSINTLGGSSGNVFLAGVTINILGSINTSGSTGSGAGSSNASGTAGNTRRRNGVNFDIDADSNIYTSNGNNITIIATGDINIGNQNIQNNSNTSLVANGINGGNINIVSKNGNVINNGIIDAVGLNGNGGQIIIAGQNSTVINNALISADGLIGGGLIQIGLANNIGSGSTLAPPVIQNPFAIYFSTGSPAQNNSNLNSSAHSVVAFNVISQATSLDSNSGISASAVNNTNSQNSITTGGQIILVGNNSLDTAAQIYANGGNGGLILLSSPTGAYQNTGYIQTNGGAGLGGTIAQSGLISTTLTGATLEANGQLGGGNITTGRDFQTSPLPGSAAQSALLPNFSSILMLPTSQVTNIDQNSTLSANAIQNGNGGNVLNWGEVLNAYGAFNARGGALGGNGGLVETSGANDVVVTGFSVNTRAPNGKAGTWLLDPTNTQPSALTQAAFQTVLTAGNNAVYVSSTGFTAPVMPLSSPGGILDVTFSTVGTAIQGITVNAITDTSSVAGAGINVNVLSSGGNIYQTLGTTISVKGSVTLDNTYGCSGTGCTPVSGFLLTPSNVTNLTVTSSTMGIKTETISAGRAVTIKGVTQSQGGVLLVTGNISSSQQVAGYGININLLEAVPVANAIRGLAIDANGSGVLITSGTASIAGGDINVQATSTGTIISGQGNFSIVANGANVNLGNSTTAISGDVSGIVGINSPNYNLGNITATTVAGVGGNVNIYVKSNGTGSALTNTVNTITAGANVVINAQNTSATSGTSAAVTYTGLITSTNGGINVTGTTAGTGTAVSLGAMTISGGSGSIYVSGTEAAAGGVTGITQTGNITDNSNGGSITFTSNNKINQTGAITLAGNTTGTGSSVTYDTTSGNKLSTIASGQLTLTGAASTTAINHIEITNGAPITTSAITVPGYILVDNTNNGTTLAANATTGTALTIGGALTSGAYAGTNAITLKAIASTAGIGIDDSASTSSLNASVGNITLNSVTSTGAGIAYTSPITATSGTVSLTATSTTGTTITATGAITGLGITVNGTATTATTITSLGVLTVNGLYVAGTTAAPTFISNSGGTYIGAINALPTLISGSIAGTNTGLTGNIQAATVVYAMAGNTSTNANYLLGWGAAATPLTRMVQLNIQLINGQLIATETAAKTSATALTTGGSTNINTLWSSGTTATTQSTSLATAGYGIANIGFSGSPVFTNSASGDITVNATGTAGSNTGITQTGAIAQNVSGGDISFTSNNKINQTGNIALAPNTSGTPSSITYDTTTGTLGSSIVAGALTLTGGVTASTAAINYIQKASGASLSIAATSVPGFILVDNTYGGTGGAGGTPTSGYLNSGTVTSSNTSALTGIAITGTLSAGTYVTLNGVSSGSASTAPGISFGGNINSSALSSGYGININGYASGSALNTSVAVTLTTGSTLIAGGDINVLAYSNGNTIYTSGGLYSFSTYGGDINIGTSANPIYAGGVAINGYNNDTFTSVIAKTVGGIGGAINIYAQNIDPTNGAAYIGGVLTADSNIVINASNTAVGSGATALFLGTHSTTHTITSNNGSVTIQGTVLGSGAGVNSVSSISAATNVSITGSQLGAGNGGGVIDTGPITASNGSVTITGTAKTTTAVTATGPITGNSITVTGTDIGTATTVVSLGAMTINPCSSACTSRDITVTATNGVAGGNTGITQTGQIINGAVASNISFTSNNKIAQAGAISLVANTAASTPATVTYNTTSGNQLSTISTGPLSIGTGTNNSAINFVEKSNGSALTIAATTMPGYILVDNTCSACGTPLTPATAAASLTTGVGVTVSGALSAANYISIAGINTSTTNAAVALGTNTLTVTNAASFPTAGVNAISVIGYKNSSTTSTVGSPGISSTGALAVQSAGGDVLFQSNGDITQTGGLTLAANTTTHAQNVKYDTTSGNGGSAITIGAITSQGASISAPVNITVTGNSTVNLTGNITSTAAGTAAAPINILAQSFYAANTFAGQGSGSSVFLGTTNSLVRSFVTRGGYIVLDGTGGVVTGLGTSGIAVTMGSIQNGVVWTQTNAALNTSNDGLIISAATTGGGNIILNTSRNSNDGSGYGAWEPGSNQTIDAGGTFTANVRILGTTNLGYTIGGYATSSYISSLGNLTMNASGSPATLGAAAIYTTSPFTSFAGSVNLTSTTVTGNASIKLGAAVTAATGVNLTASGGTNIGVSSIAGGTILTTGGSVNILSSNATTVYGVSMADSITGPAVFITANNSNASGKGVNVTGGITISALNAGAANIYTTAADALTITSTVGTAGNTGGINVITTAITNNSIGGNVSFITNGDITATALVSFATANTTNHPQTITYDTTTGNKTSAITTGQFTYNSTGATAPVNYVQESNGSNLSIGATSVSGSILVDNTNGGTTLAANATTGTAITVNGALLSGALLQGNDAIILKAIAGPAGKGINDAAATDTLFAPIGNINLISNTTTGAGITYASPIAAVTGNVNITATSTTGATIAATGAISGLGITVNGTATTATTITSLGVLTVNGLYAAGTTAAPTFISNTSGTYIGSINALPTLTSGSIAGTNAGLTSNIQAATVVYAMAGNTSTNANYLLGWGAAAAPLTRMVQLNLQLINGKLIATEIAAKTSTTALTTGSGTNINTLWASGTAATTQSTSLATAGYGIANIGFSGSPVFTYSGSGNLAVTGNGVGSTGGTTGITQTGNVTNGANGGNITFTSNNQINQGGNVLMSVANTSGTASLISYDTTLGNKLSTINAGAVTFTGTSTSFINYQNIAAGAQIVVNSALNVPGYIKFDNTYGGTAGPGSTPTSGFITTSPNIWSLATSAGVAIAISANLTATNGIYIRGAEGTVASTTVSPSYAAVTIAGATLTTTGSFAAGTDAINIAGVMTPINTSTTAYAIGISGNTAVNNNSTGGNTNIVAYNGRYYDAVTVTNASTAGALELSAIGTSADIVTVAGTLFTQNSNAGVFIATSNNGNVTPPKIVNNGTGPVVIEAGAYFAAGTVNSACSATACGQITAISGNNITSPNGNVYLYAGSPGTTAGGTMTTPTTLAYLSPSLGTLTFNNTLFGQAYAAGNVAATSLPITTLAGLNTANVAAGTGFSSFTTTAANGPVIQFRIQPTVTANLSGNITKVYGTNDPLATSGNLATVGSLDYQINTLFVKNSTINPGYLANNTGGCVNEPSGCMKVTVNGLNFMLGMDSFINSLQALPPTPRASYGTLAGEQVNGTSATSYTSSYAYNLTSNHGTLVSSGISVALAPATGTVGLVITPVPLTITANSVTTSTGVSPTLTTTVAGLVNTVVDGVTLSDSVNATASLFQPANINTPGVYAGGCSPACPSGTTTPSTINSGIKLAASTSTGAGNYTITYVPGTLTVSSSAVVTITLLADSKVYGNTATTTNGLSYNNSGILNLTGLSLGNVTSASCGCTISGLPTGDTLTGLTLTSLGGILNAGVGAGSAAGGTYTITPSVGVVAGPNTNIIWQYVGNFMTVTARPITITANTVNSTYGSTATVSQAAGPSGGYQVAAPTSTSGLIAGDAITAVAVNYNNGSTNSTTVPGNLNATTYSNAVVVGSASGTGGFNATNYNITYTPANLVVAPLAVTLTAAPQTTTYGTALALGTTAFTSSIPVLPNGDVISGATLSGSCSGCSTGTVAGTTAAGSYTITPSSPVLSSGSSSNYAFTYGTGALTVDPAIVTIAPVDLSAAGQSVIYNGAAQTFNASTGFTVSGLQNGQTLQFGTTGLASGTNVGNYANNITATGPNSIITGITGSGASLNNYTINISSQGSLSITPAPLSVTGATTNVSYNGSLQTNASPTVVGLVGQDLLTSNGINVTGVASGTNAATYADTLAVSAKGITQLTNYTLSKTNGSLIIGKLAASITGATTIDPYNGALQSNTYTTSGILPGDLASSSAIAISGAAAATHVSQGTVPDVFSVAGSSAGNYNFSYVPGSITITPVALSVVGANTTQVYNATTQTNAVATLTGLKGSDAATISGSYGAGKNVGTYADALSVSLSNPSDYTIGVTNGSIAITPATITISGITANNKVYDATTAATLNLGTISYSGVYAGDTVSVNTSNLAGTFVDKNVGTAKTVNISGVVLGGTSSANYQLSGGTNTTTIANITPAPLNITGTSVTTTYNANSQSLASPTVTGVIAGDNVVVSTTGGVGTNAGTYGASYAASGTDAANYSVTSNTPTLTINKANLVITANNANSFYGVVDPALTASVAGLQGSDTAPSYSVTREAGTAVGTYPITASGASSNTNYNISYVPGVFTISPTGVLVITMNAASTTYGTAATPTTSTVQYATPAGSGPVTVTTLTNSSGNIWTDGSYSITITPTTTSVGVTPVVSGLSTTWNVGSYTNAVSNTNTYTQAGSPFTGVSTIANTLTITPAPLTLTIADVSKTYNANSVTAAQITAGSLTGGVSSGVTVTSGALMNSQTIAGLGGVVYSGDAIGAINASGSTYAINGSVGSGFSNYAVTVNSGALMINTAPLVVNGALTNQTYSGAVQTNAAATIAGLQGSDTLAVNGYATGTHVGTTTDSLVASGAAASNYSITYNNGSLTINPAALVVTGTANQYAYNGALQTNTGASVSGLKGADTATVAGYATATHVAQGIVSDALVATLSNPTDYTVNYVQGSLQITPIVITAAVNSATVMYNASSQTTGFVVAGLKGSDTATAASGTATGTNVGSYTSNLVINTSSDYTVGAITNGTLIITPAPLSISAGLTANNKVYDTTNAATIAVTGTQTLTGVLGTDVITVSSTGPYTGATFSQSNVGSGLVVTPATTSTTINGVAYTTMAGVTLSGAQAGNYYVTGVGSQSLTANITPAPLTISSGLIASNKVYDGTNAASITAATQTLSGVLVADIGNVAVSSSGPYVGGFSQSNVGTALAVTATTTPTTIAGASYDAMSGVTLSGSALGNYYVTGISAPLTANITPYIINFGASSGPNITAVANNKVYTATTAANGSLAMVNLFGTDSVSVSYNNATFANPNVGTAIPVTFAGVTLSGPSAANYVIGSAPVTAPANISQALLTITAIDKASFYTQAIAPLTNAYAPAVGLLGSDSVTGASVSTTATATSPVGSYPISISGATGTGLSNYQINYVPATYTIVGPGALIVSTAGVVTPYGTGTSGTLIAPALPTATYTTGGTNISALTYISSSSSGGITSYVFKDAANVTVTFDLSPSNTSTSTSGNVNVGSYAYATSNLSAGSTGLTSATPSGNFTVTPLALTVSATPTTVTYNGSTQNQSSAVISPAVQSTGAGTDVVTVAGISSGKNAGIYGSNLVVAGADVSNYNVTIVNADLTITPYVLGSGGTGTPAIAATANNKVYDTTTVATGNLAINNLFAGDVVAANYSSAAFTGNTGANVHNGTTVIFNGVTLSGAAAANYAVATSPITATANITPAPLTISAGLTANNKVYDTTTAATIAITGAQTLFGVLGADIVSVNSTGPYTGATFSQSNVGAGLVITPAASIVNGLTTMTGVTLTGAAASNYYVTGVGPQTLTANITPAPLTISSGLTANNKAYDGTTAATISSGTQVLSGLVGSDINTSNVIVSSSGPYAATFASPNVANGITVTANTTPTVIAGGTYNAMSGATLSGISAGNYYVTGASSPISANITPYIINFGSGGTGPNINAVANNKVYTSTDTASGALSMVNLFAGDSVAVSFASATFANPNVANGITVTFNTPVLSGASAGNYQIGSTAITASANITPAPLTVTAVNKSSFYSQSLASLTIAPAVGLLGTDTVTGATLATTASTTGANASAGTYPISVSSATGSGVGNYAITYVPATYTIMSPGQLLITTSGVTTVYGTGTSGNILTPAQPVASYSTGGSNISALTFVSAATTGNVTSYIYRDATNAVVSFNLTPTGTTTSTSGNINVGSYAYAASGLVSASSGLTSSSAVATGNFTVTPLAVTITAPATGPLTYNGQVQNQGAATSSPAILTNDLVAISGLASGKNVGVYGSNLAVSGVDVSNYNFTLVNNNLTITPYIIGSVAGGPTLTATANNKVYNTNTTATGSLAMSNLFPGDTVAANYTGATFASANVNLPASPQTVTFSGVTLSGAAASNYALASSSTTATANITQAPVTISGLVANNKVYTSTTADVISGTPIVTGLLGSDTSTVSGTASGTFASPNVANNIAVSANLAGLTIGNGNYYITGVTTPLAANITPAPLTINSGLVAANKVYDTTTAASIGVSGTQTLSGILGSDAANLAVSSLGPYAGTFGQATVGNGVTITPTTASTMINGLSYTTMAGVSLSGSAAGNYYVTGPSTTLSANITKAPLTITANNQASFVTQSTNPLSYSSIGLLGSDVISGVTLTTTASSSMPAGSYAIGAASATGAAMTNYQINYVPGTYTIVPAGQLLISSAGAITPYTTLANFANPTVAYATSGGAVINNLYLTTSSTVNGVTTYTYSDGAGASLSFNFAPISPALSGSNNLNVGTYGLSAANFQIAGSNITNIAPVVTGNLTVTPLPVTITAQATTYVYNGTNRTLSNSTSSPGIVSGDSVTIVDSLSNKNVGIYTSNLSTTGSDIGNYQFTYANANLTITPYVIGSVAGGPAITASANNRVYNTNTAATGSLAITNLFPGDVVSADYSSASFDNANAGLGKTVTFNGVTLSGAAAANYVLGNAATTTTANITPAPVTISGLFAQNKVYDGNLLAIITGTPSLVGLLGMDASTLAGSVLSGEFASANPGIGISVIANLKALLLGNSNYYIAGVTVPLVANITPAPQAVIATPVQTINNMTIVQQQNTLPLYMPASVMPTPPTLLQRYSDIKGDTLYVRDRDDMGSYIDAIPVPPSGSFKFPLPNQIVQNLIDLSGANHSASSQGYKYLLLTDGASLEISDVNGGPLPAGVTYSPASRSFTVAKLSAVTLPISVKVSIKRGGTLVSEKIIEVTR